MSDAGRPRPKGSSGSLRLGLADCPICDGKKLSDDGRPCRACDGIGKVTMTRHHDLVGLKPSDQAPISAIDLDRDTDPIPPTLPDPNKEPDT